MPNYQNCSKKTISKLVRNCNGTAFWICTFLQVDWLSESANLHFQTSRYGLSDIIIHVHAVSILPLFHIDYEYNQTPRKKHTKKAPLKHRTKLNISTKTNTSQGHKLTKNKKKKSIFIWKLSIPHHFDVIYIQFGMITRPLTKQKKEEESLHHKSYTRTLKHRR